MRKLIYLVSIFLPWKLRRKILAKVFGFQLDPTSRIGLSWIQPGKLIMGPHAQIGHFTVCKGVETVELGEHATIGNGNWISGFPLALSQSTGHFAHQTERKPELLLEEHAAITHRHIIDCTNHVKIGRFSTMAGYASQILTHSINIEDSRQDSYPVEIGQYCFVGTNVVLLGGSKLPDYSVLGAKSLLNKAHTEPYQLYGGVPAKPLRELDPETRYFTREVGYVR